MSAVEIRNYEGDGSDLAELIDRVWRQTYGGKQRIPLWDLAYLRWRLLDPRAGGRDYMVCAYRDGRIVGCLLAEPMDFEVHGRAVKGTMSSWLTVDPEVRAPGLALRLVEGLRERQSRDGIAFSMGYSSSDPSHPARKFWDYLAKRKPDDFIFLNRLLFWARVFEPGIVSASALDAFERYSPWVARNIPWAYQGWRPRRGVRPWRADDLSRCRDIVLERSRGVDVRLTWPSPRLELQLENDFARTLVLERGERAGFVNYYPIRYLGTSDIRVGMIDFLAGDLGLAGEVALLKSAGHEMRERGLHAAFMMGSSTAPKSSLLAAGFVPFPAGLDLFCFFHDPELGLRPKGSFDVLFG